jgi:hypothetical protein
MHRVLTALVLTSALALTAGCYDCDMMARESVSVTVSDADGATIDDVLVRYLMVAEDWADHEDCEPAYDDASHWSCGFEAEGEIEVEASAPGFLTETQTVTVSGGRCHVATEAMDFWLEPAP